MQLLDVVADGDSSLRDRPSCCCLVQAPDHKIVQYAAGLARCLCFMVLRHLRDCYTRPTLPCVHHDGVNGGPIPHSVRVPGSLGPRGRIVPRPYAKLT